MPSASSASRWERGSAISYFRSIRNPWSLQRSKRDGAETVLFSSGKLANRVVFTPDTGFASDGSGITFVNKAAVFNARGFPVEAGGSGNALGGGRLKLCAATWGGSPTKDCRVIAVSSAGRITLTK